MKRAGKASGQIQDTALVVWKICSTRIRCHLLSTKEKELDYMESNKIAEE